MQYLEGVRNRGLFFLAASGLGHRIWTSFHDGGVDDSQDVRGNMTVSQAPDGPLLFRGKFRIVAAVLIGLVSFAGIVSAQQPFRADGPPPVDLSVVYEPQWVNRGGTGILIYELIVANPFERELRYRSLEVVDEKGELLADRNGRELRRMAERLPSTTQDAAGAVPEDWLTLAPGERYLLYFWIESEPGRNAPRSISHRWTVEAVGSTESMIWKASGPSLPVHRDAITIDPPVRGTWLVGNGFEQPSNHRNYYIVNQNFVIPQRFGADFVKLDHDGANADGDGTANSHYYAYREPVFAVADGEVVIVQDDMPELEPLESNRTRFKWSEYPGNRIVLKLGPRHYALYGHLLSGSIKVKVGDRVRRGIEIARIGLTGNATSPHLHFHVSEGPLSNDSQGMPFHFSSFERLVEDYRFRSDQRPLPAKGVEMTDSVPANRWVIRFVAPSPSALQAPMACNTFAKQETSPYVLPFQIGDAFRVTNTTGHYVLGNGGVGLYAIDFGMPIGTPVVAARGGTVVAVRESFHDYNGIDLEENFVFIKHDDGSVGRYFHLTYNGALVELGDSVEQGASIGLSGNTGQSAGPHLHFDVQQCGPNLPPEYNKLPCGQTLPVSFSNTVQHRCGLTYNKSYRAVGTDKSIRQSSNGSED